MTKNPVLNPVQLTEEQKRIASLLWDKKGPKHQTTRAAEELCELATELLHLARGCGEGENVPSEIADVLFTLSQLIEGLGLASKVASEIQRKALRAESRLNEQLKAVQ